MWENETIVLITSLKKRLLAGNNKVRFSKISADTALPPFIKTIFQNQVEIFVQSESPIKIQSTPHFDLSENDLSNIKDRFFEVFREAASFSGEEVEDILRMALIQRMDYLVKPIDTMRRLLFNGDNTVSMEKMNLFLNPFIKILPYAGNLIDECQRLNYKAIESDEYTNLVNEMIERMTEAEPVKIAIGDFSVLMDFISETKGEDVSRVEGQVVQEFMADRNLWGFRRAIDVEMKLGKEDFDLVDLEMTLKRYLELKAEFSQEADTESSVRHSDKIESELIEETIKEKEDLSAEDIEPSIESSIIETEEQEQELSFEELNLSEIENETFNLDDIVNQEPVNPIEEDVKITPPDKNINSDEGWDLDDVLGSDNLIQDAASREPKAEKKEEPKPEAEEKKEEKTQPKKQMRIIRRDQNQPSEVDVSAQDDLHDNAMSTIGGLRQMIDSKTEKVFVKKLFGNDQSAYDFLMNKLEESESWRVAKILIDNELFKRDVDPFSREAIKLVDLVYSRYYPEEGVGGK